MALHRPPRADTSSSQQQRVKGAPSTVVFEVRAVMASVARSVTTAALSTLIASFALASPGSLIGEVYTG
jgi:hypothetical protein